MALHKNLPASEIHLPYSFEYATSSARLAATGVLAAVDVGRLQSHRMGSGVIWWNLDPG
jgi:hypothetical protein